MANKQNPILAAFEAKKEREFQNRLACNSELNMMAALIAGNDLGFLASKRADIYLEEIVEVKMKIAKNIIEDTNDDKTMEYTKADLSRRLKQILGTAGWDRCKGLFPMLRDYW